VTDSSSASVPPGWYPDNANPAIQRWWDGTQWTEHTQQAYVAGGVAAAQLKAPEGTSWNTPWIWLVVLLPLVSLFTLFTFNLDGYMQAIISDPSRPDIAGAMAALFSPAFVIAIVLSWVIIALTIFFAYRDYKELEKRGVPKPFHWGFAFLALAGYGIVYPIGRGIVTNRRGAGGLVVTWVAIATLVVSIIVAIVWSVVLTNQIMGEVLSTIPSR
jgi:hypothetical protein